MDKSTPNNYDAYSFKERLHLVCQNAKDEFVKILQVEHAKREHISLIGDEIDSKIDSTETNILIRSNEQFYANQRKFNNMKTKVDTAIQSRDIEEVKQLIRQFVDE